MTITSLVHTVKREARLGYTSHTTSLIHGGGKLSFEVKRGLLQPAADVAGLLRFNGSTLYIPRGRQITIGSSKESDIRIIDSKINELHASITPFDGGFIINDLSLGNDLVVRDKVSGQITRLFSTPHEMTSDGSIFFRLSGISNKNKARLLEVKVEISPANITEAVQELFAMPSPSIEQVSPETALVRIERKEIFSVASETDLDIQFKEFLAKSNIINKRLKWLSFGLIASGQAAGIMTVYNAIRVYPAEQIRYMVELSNTWLAISGLMAVMFTFFIKNIAMSISFDSIAASLKNIVDNKTSNEIARSLSKLPKKEQDSILSLIDDFNGDRATAIRKERKLLAKSNANLPPQQPAADKARTRVAESPASGDSRKRISEPPTPAQEVVEVEVGIEETAEGERSV